MVGYYLGFHHPEIQSTETPKWHKVLFIAITCKCAVASRRAALLGLLLLYHRADMCVIQTICHSKSESTRRMGLNIIPQDSYNFITGNIS